MLEMDQDRMPPLSPAELSPAQRAAIAAFEASRRSTPEGPWIPLLRSPELMPRVSGLGEYLRYKTCLPPRLSEFLILLTARHWTQQFEWQIHGPIALASGVPKDTFAAIAEGRRPPGMTHEEALLHSLFTELISNKRVSDATYAALVESFGERGVVDAVGVIGYYSLLAMIMNTAQTGPDEVRTIAPLRPLP
jgi:4-carboxymuconolactone decarboxylase